MKLELGTEVSTDNRYFWASLRYGLNRNINSDTYSEIYDAFWPYSFETKTECLKGVL